MSETKRLLGTAGHGGCKYGCIYCFTRHETYQRCPRLDLLRTRDLIDASGQSQIVQPACDTELFLHPNWRDYLDELVSTQKTISFATKDPISQEAIGILEEINRLQIKNGRVLHVGVTIVRLRDWTELEPNAPSPEVRIDTLRRLWEAGIPTTVMVRPMMPLLSPEELDDLVEKTHRFCYGYVSGPLYMTKEIEEHLLSKGLELDVAERVATWQEGKPTLRVVESPNLEEALRKSAKERGRVLFESNEDAALHCQAKVHECSTVRDPWSEEARRESVGTVYIVDRQNGEFLLLFHKQLGAWLAPGGHVERGETPAQAAVREAKEELDVDVQLLDLRGGLDCDGKDYRRVKSTGSPAPFCTIEEFIHPVGELEPHIHVDSVYVGVINVSDEHVKMDLEEVGARDWFDLERIEKLETFDNVRMISRAIHEALGGHR